MRGFKSGAEPGGLGGGADAGEGLAELRRRPEPALALETGALLEMDGRAHLAQHLVERAASLDAGTGALQPLEMALRHENDQLRAFTGCQRPVALGKCCLRIAHGRGIEHAVDGQLRGIADDGFDVIDFDGAGVSCIKTRPVFSVGL